MKLKISILALCSAFCFAPAMAQDTPTDSRFGQSNIGAGGRPIGADWSRSPVYAENAMAATAHPLATQVALDIMRDGGNAVDAAIAANATLGLMEPTGNGIGGDLFAIIWDPETEKLYGLNASGRAPKDRSLADLQEKIRILNEQGKWDKDTIPPMGSLPVTVPGAVDGWGEMHERFGKMHLRMVLEPAAKYAEDGHPVAPIIAYYWHRNFSRFPDYAALIEEFDNAEATYLIDGKTPKAGQIFKNPDLAKTYRRIGRKGHREFYEGKMAKTMANYMTRIGGDLTLDDFKAHQSEWVEPASVHYKGIDLYELPPNGQGYAALQMLSILKNVDLRQFDRESPEAFHYMVEAKRLAFEDLAKYYVDPDFYDAPLQELISDTYGQERFALIDPNATMTEVAAGDPKLEDGDTTYLTVADQNGMMVSLIQSNYRGMGSGLVPDGLGFMFQDRGELFSMDENHANVYEAGKRPFHTIIPAFAMKDGKPWLSFGLMGGSMQPQGHVQIIVNLVDYGMNLQEAGDAARFLHSGGSSSTDNADTDIDQLGVINLEPGVPAETIAALEAMGHKTRIVDNGVMFGGYQAIMYDAENGVYIGATEMRKDGQAQGF